MGDGKEVDEKTTVKLSKNECTIIADLLITETSGETKLLIGNETLEELAEKQEKLKELQNKFPKIFNGEPTEGYAGIECEIETEPGKKVRIKQRTVPQNLIQGAKETIKKLEKAKYIEPSSSSWFNPIRPVPKLSGAVRITCNMQFLNNIVKDDKYNIPNIQRIIDKTQGMKLFTVIVEYNYK